jgi:outer membrane protein OmpA-like peptidoglycan-associated protein
VALGVPLPRGFAIIGEVRGLVGIEFPKGASLTSTEAPSELAAGLRWRARFGLELNLAVGVGLTRGYGTPDRARAIFGVKYLSPDRPRVAVGSAPTARPLPPPPPPPVTPPPPPEPRMIGPQPAPPDADRDGVADALDRCPDKAGPADNQGCPDFDSDGDGFVDRQDKCPFDPEVFNAVDDDDGCPDQPAALASFAGDKIIISEPVLFEKDGSVVDKRSNRLLGVVAHLLQLHPEILKLRVEGHLDNKMPPYEGLELSRARAAAVRRWLIAQGKVDAKRLTAQGFGGDRPIGDNRDFIGRAKNRRIELVVMQRLDASP